jgi:PleD family two-component response regulator
MDAQLRVLIVDDSADDELALVEELRKGGFDPAATRVYTRAAMVSIPNRRELI